ncbi:hypothetical protein V1264_017280 [Littorina saxatilis]|uniref:Uncharacterized protein n=1 Tax=Littorina saxatilis TaxID=31220 RepID=A0AAN9BMC5_9CAEN
MQLPPDHHAAITMDKDKHHDLADRLQHQPDLLLTASLKITCILLTASPLRVEPTSHMTPLQLHREDRTILWRCQTSGSGHPTPSSECSH